MQQLRNSVTDLLSVKLAVMRVLATCHTQPGKRKSTVDNSGSQLRAILPSRAHTAMPEALGGVLVGKAAATGF